MILTKEIIIGFILFVTFSVLAIIISLKYLSHKDNFFNRYLMVVLTPMLILICALTAFVGSRYAFTAYFCPQCDSYYNEMTLDKKENAYCPECGFRFGSNAPKIDKEFCPQCGDEYKINEKYCSFCGEKRGVTKE